MTGEPASWPPRDPTIPAEAPFVLPPSPWTYENGSVNPNLEPYNSQTREATRPAKRRPRGAEPGTYSLPPYHPDYQEGPETPDDSSSDYTLEEGDGRIRRGSEGYEVRPVDREAMLSRYLKQLGEEPGRYRRYIPQPESEEYESDEDLPLAPT